MIQCEQLQEQLTEAKERSHSRLPSQEPGSEEGVADVGGEASLATPTVPSGASVKRKLSGDDVSDSIVCLSRGGGEF